MPRAHLTFHAPPPPSSAWGHGLRGPTPSPRGPYPPPPLGLWAVPPPSPVGSGSGGGGGQPVFQGRAVRRAFPCFDPQRWARGATVALSRPRSDSGGPPSCPPLRMTPGRCLPQPPPPPPGALAVPRPPTDHVRPYLTPGPRCLPRGHFGGVVDRDRQRCGPFRGVRPPPRPPRTPSEVTLTRVPPPPLGPRSTAGPGAAEPPAPGRFAGGGARGAPRGDRHACSAGAHAAGGARPCLRRQRPLCGGGVADGWISSAQTESRSPGARPRSWGLARARLTALDPGIRAHRGSNWGPMGLFPPSPPKKRYGTWALVGHRMGEAVDRTEPATHDCGAS